MVLRFYFPKNEDIVRVESDETEVPKGMLSSFPTDPN